MRTKGERNCKRSTLGKTLGLGPFELLALIKNPVYVCIHTDCVKVLCLHFFLLSACEQQKRGVLSNLTLRCFTHLLYLSAMVLAV